MFRKSPFTIKNESFDIKEAFVKSRKKIPSVFESKDSIRLSPLYGLVQKHKCRRYHSSHYDEGDHHNKTYWFFTISF